MSAPGLVNPARPARGIAAPRFLRTMGGRIGAVIVIVVVLVALIGPLITPHPIAASIGVPGQGPTAQAPLGTDFLGRDVLSRTLAGGRSVLVTALAATALTYTLALLFGLVAGYTRSLLDPLLMRLVDLLLSVPALLMLLILASGLGGTTPVLILGVALVLFPGAARIVRTAAMEVSVTGYVESAVAQGEPAASVMVIEILPNIVQVVLADLGIRFSAAIVLIASLNYLGVGQQPPLDDWALMITQNREILSLNPWAVFAPALMLGLLTVGANLVADSYARSLGRSRRSS